MSCNGNSLPLNQVLLGDCREVMAGFPEDSIDLVVTSPPYWGLRDYGNSHQVWGGDPNCKHIWDGESHTFKYSGGISPGYTGQFSDDRTHFERTTNYCSKCGAWGGSLGLEPRPHMFVDHLVEISREIRRVLKPRGSFWLNLGDTYYTHTSKRSGQFGADIENERNRIFTCKRHILKTDGWLQEKQLLGIPWRVAIALQDEGWVLRNCVIWYKRNHMPESVKDRLTKSYEFFFFLVKQPRYYFNLDAIREPYVEASIQRLTQPPLVTRMDDADKLVKEPTKLTKHDQAVGRIGNFSYADSLHVKSNHPKGKNPGDVWDIPTQPFPGAHFAVFPEKLVEPIIKACCPPKGVVLDPFAGSGTCLRVARRLGRSFIGVEINPEYVELCLKRVKADGYRKPPEGVNPLSDYVDLHPANQKEEKI